MSLSYLLRLSGLASILSGALLLIAAIAAQFPMSGGVDYYILFRLTFFLAHAFIFFALMGIYLRQHEEIGRFGLFSFALAVIGNVFFTTVLGVSAFLNLQSDFVGIGAILLPLSLFLLAIATSRARILPVAAAWLMFLGPLLNPLIGRLVPSGPDFFNITNIIGEGLSPVLFAAGLAWMGFTLWSEKKIEVVAPA